MKTQTPMKLMALPKCPACEREVRKLIFSIKDSEVYECTVCGLRYLDPCLSPDAMADAYESNESLQEMHDFHEGYYDYGSLDKKSKTRDDFEKALALLEDKLQGDGERRIFDVGFGNGFFLALAKQRGWHVSGIDTSAQNAKMVKEKFGLELQTGLFEEEVREEGQFDVVSFWDVVEHFPQPSLALRHAHKVLKKGGYVLIGLPHDKSLLMRLSTMLYTLSGERESALDKVYFLEHVSYYHKNSLETLLRANGFEPCELFYSSTDLEKYTLPPAQKTLAKTILFFGKLLGMQNRMIGIYRAV